MTASDGSSEVAEGAQNVELTITATADAPMPGIFEIDVGTTAVNFTSDGATDETVTRDGTGGRLVIDQGDRSGFIKITVDVSDGAASGTGVNTADDTVYVGFATGDLTEASFSTVTVSVNGVDRTITVGTAKLTVTDNDSGS